MFLFCFVFDLFWVHVCLDRWMFLYVLKENWTCQQQKILTRYHSNFLIRFSCHTNVMVSAWLLPTPSPLPFLKSSGKESYCRNILPATEALVPDFAPIHPQKPHCQPLVEIHSMRNTCKLSSYHLIWSLCTLITSANYSSTLPILNCACWAEACPGMFVATKTLLQCLSFRENLTNGSVLVQYQDKALPNIRSEKSCAASGIHGCQNYATVSTAASVATHVPQPNTVWNESDDIDNKINRS